MRKLLLATGNRGKAKEISAFLETSQFEIVTLADLSDVPPEPEETGTTLEENAILKAKYYADKTGMLALADDSGFFIDTLDGWPGIKAARVADTPDSRCQTILKKLEGETNRNATYRTAMACYDPLENTYHITNGDMKLEVLEAMPTERKYGHGYDPILKYVGELRSLDQMTTIEKNAGSSRGKALQKMRYHFDNSYTPKDLVVPFSLIIKNGRVLMILRNDPHRPEYHLKWEFPGGGVDRGETMHSNVLRETREEAGYEVEVVKLLQYISVELQTYPTFEYQIYLVPYVCKPVQQLKQVNNEQEVVKVKWFDLDDVLNHDLIGENARMYKQFLPELKDVVKEYSL